MYESSHSRDVNQMQDELSGEGWTRRNWTSRLPYYIPILTWLPEYSWRSNLYKDLIAGAHFPIPYL